MKTYNLVVHGKMVAHVTFEDGIPMFWWISAVDEDTARAIDSVPHGRNYLERLSARIERLNRS